MSTRADIIDLLDNATEKSLEKILDSVKKILREEKGNKVYTLEEIKAKAIPIAKKYGVKRLSLFGSYARGEADAQSDLDFLYDSGNGKIRTTFDYIDFIYDLEDEFKCHIDAVSERIRDKKFLEEIKQDEVLLYEETA
ncbi:MAG: nucleotidyltransferase domain-containing protein [Selenomonadaceae bacterium]|nr:nucleotidyltransferase domain-containing protein [Selenomonadaceae bacterium]